MAAACWTTGLAPAWGVETGTSHPVARSQGYFRLYFYCSLGLLQFSQAGCQKNPRSQHYLQLEFFANRSYRYQALRFEQPVSNRLSPTSDTAGIVR